MEKYNGWTNWETWDVNLWVMNDEGLYYAMNQHPKPWTAESARDFLLDILPEGTPDMSGAEDYCAVNWGEIAAAWNEK